MEARARRTYRIRVASIERLPDSPDTIVIPRSEVLELRGCRDGFVDAVECSRHDARDAGAVRVEDLLWYGFWGGQRPSLADYVTMRGPTDRAPAAGGCESCLRSRTTARISATARAAGSWPRGSTDERPSRDPLVAGSGGSCSRPISSELRQECPPTQPPGARKPRQK
jgi:hypothetical protein